MKFKKLILFGGAFAIFGVVGWSLGQIIYSNTESYTLEEVAKMNHEERVDLVEEIMEAKCAACHGENPSFPAIFNMASFGLLQRDVDGAQRSFLIEPELTIRQEPVNVVKMYSVLEKQSMPPKQYSMVHFTSVLTKGDLNLLRSVYTKEAAQKHMFEAIAIPAQLSEEEALKVRLGHLLYFDKRLSSDNTISCASCHDLTKGGTDNKEKSEGVKKDGKAQFGGVNAPTVYNAEHHILQFWDGRADDLKAQAGGPPLNPVEMGYAKPEDWDHIILKLMQEPALVDLFEKAYPGQAISADTITDAIAAFEKTLVTPGSAFDRYLQGDKNALSDAQVAGMKSFENNCASCHNGPALGGRSFEYINTYANLRDLHLGSSYEEGAFGRADHTKNTAHTDMFRVPTLRNVALTAPYFHTGKVARLDEAVRLMFQTQVKQKASAEDVSNMTAFLEAQTGTYLGKPLTELKPEELTPAPLEAPAPAVAPAVEGQPQEAPAELEELDPQPVEEFQL